MSQPEQGMPVLELSSVNAGYKSVPMIRNIDLTLHSGDAIAVIGANGAGKTTMLRAITGQISAMAGDIRFLGSPIAALPTHARARLGIGYAPEGRQLFHAMSVIENLEVGAARVKSEERSRRVQRMLDIFPKLRPRSKTDCGLLSGGEQQMVAIARALMPQPRLLLLDEPSTGLAPRVISELYASLATLLSSGLTILVAEQNARAALRLAKRAIVLEDGRIVASGPAAELAGDPRVVDAYVGLGAQDLSWSSAAHETA
jgi:branched-chain amino acid transport system ATP-binding protein